ncbi:CHASE3 domain-containing protein [Flavihumibacter stibioxidans]|nr:CHASE3 domain-containing protein [Flavihumibacter stibioxidans]
MLRHISQTMGWHLLVQQYEKLLSSRIKPVIRSVMHKLEERQVLQRLYNSGLKWEHRLLMGSLVIIFGIVLLAAKIYQNNLINQATHDRIELSRKVLFETEQVSAAVKDLELGVRGYVITGNISFLGPFYSTRQTIFSRINSLKLISSDNTAQQARFEALVKHLKQNLVYLETAISLTGTSRAAAQKYILEKTDFSRIKTMETLIADLKAEEYRNLARRKENNVSSNEIYTRLNLILAATLIGLIFIAYYLLWRNMRAAARAKDRLESNKQLLQSIIDNTSSAIYVKDIFGRLTMMNKQFARIYGNQGDGMDSSADDQILESGKLQESQENFQVDGRLHHFYSIRFPLVNRNGEIYALAGISTDITGIILQQQISRQKEIIETTIEARQRERKEIGMELHDNISQLLASAKMMLDTARYNEANKEALLEKARNDVYSAISETRKLSHALVQPELEGESLSAAISGLAGGLRLSGKMKVKLKISSKKQLDALDAKQKLCIYRTIQEQTSNIIRYSKAGNVQIDLLLVADKVRLTISDDGVGFDHDRRNDGIGFKNIASRLETLGGFMQVRTSPGRGCQLAVEFPVA